MPEARDIEAAVSNARRPAIARQLRSYAHPDEFSPELRRFIEGEEGRLWCGGLGWYRNFVECVEQPRTRYRFYAVLVGDNPQVVLPVAIRPSAWPGHHELHALSNYYSPLYQPVLARDSTADDLAFAIRAAREELGLFSRSLFGPMDGSSEAYATLESAFASCAFKTFRYFAHSNWYHEVDGLTWEQYLATRKGKLRSDIKRMEKKLEQEGASLEILVDPADTERGISDYILVYGKSWKKDEPHPHFVPGLIRAASQRGWLRLGIVRLHGQPIAVQFWVVANGKAEIYKVAYDDAFKRYSPGTVLTAHLMRHVIGIDRVREVDYLMGDDEYKRNWMSQRRERLGLVAYDLRSPGGIAGVAIEATLRAIKRLRARFGKTATN